MKNKKLSRDISLFAQKIKRFHDENPDELMPMDVQILYFILWKHSRQFRREIKNLYGRKRFKLKPWMKGIIFALVASIITAVITLDVLWAIEWFVNR